MVIGGSRGWGGVGVYVPATEQCQDFRIAIPIEGAPQAQCAQCARSATIWVSGRTRDPYFETLGAPRGIMVTRSGGFDF